MLLNPPKKTLSPSNTQKIKKVCLWYFFSNFTAQCSLFLFKKVALFWVANKVEEKTSFSREKKAIKNDQEWKKKKGETNK